MWYEQKVFFLSDEDRIWRKLCSPDLSSIHAAQNPNQVNSNHCDLVAMSLRWFEAYAIEFLL